jgi:hypothetical protein
MFRLRSNHSIATRPSRKRCERKHCDARIKNPVSTKGGVARSRGPRCRNWAMPNGRCRVHGGASTGPRTAEGKALVVAAMVQGRRKWIERLHAEGKRAPGGRTPASARPSERLQKIAAKRAKRLTASREENRARAKGRDYRSAIREQAMHETERARANAQPPPLDRVFLACLAAISPELAIAHGWNRPARGPQFRHSVIPK